MTDQIIGMILSICGMLLTVISFQFNKKNLIITVQTIGSLFFLVSYIFSKGGIAVILNIIYLIRNTIFLKVDTYKKEKKDVIASILCLIYIVSYILYIIYADITKNDMIWNILPVIGAVFGTIAVANSNPNKFRCWKIGDSISWLAFNLYIGIGALGGIIGEVFNLISIIIAINLYLKSKKTQQIRS